MLAAELDDKAAAFAKLAHGVIEQAMVGIIDVPAVSKDLNAMEDLAAWIAGFSLTTAPKSTPPPSNACIA